MNNTAYKPYQVVMVEEDGYRHYAETISMPTPKGTIMVRRVPGDPTTMAEVSLSRVSHVGSKRKNWWVHYASVRGGGSFPVDMLRYDYCAPVDFTVTEDYPYFNRKGEEVLVGRLSDSHKQPWTYARWSSFLWGARHVRTVPYTVGG